MAIESHCVACEQNQKDRPKWGPGAWYSEPDRIEFEAHGLPCILHRSHVGAWCGYVGVSPGHPFHGLSYDDVSDISVHGGLTYAKPCQGHVCHVPKPGEPDNLWWFGFDCAHAGDMYPSIHHSFDNGEYRDAEYVRAETTSLAEQLSQAAKP